MAMSNIGSGFFRRFFGNYKQMLAEILSLILAELLRLKITELGPANKPISHLNCLTESQTEVRKSSPEWIRVTKMQNRNEMNG